MGNALGGEFKNTAGCRLRIRPVKHKRWIRVASNSAKTRITTEREDGSVFDALSFSVGFMKSLYVFLGGISSTRERI